MPSADCAFTVTAVSPANSRARWPASVSVPSVFAAFAPNTAAVPSGTEGTSSIDTVSTSPSSSRTATAAEALPDTAS